MGLDGIGVDWSGEDKTQRGISPEAGSTPVPATSSTSKDRRIEDFVACWNEVVKGRLPRVTTITDVRRRDIAVALRVEPDLAVWRVAFDLAAADDWLAGRGTRKGATGKPWRADLDFVIRKDQIGKTLDRARAEPTGPVEMTPAEVEADMARRRAKTEALFNGPVARAFGGGS